MKLPFKSEPKPYELVQVGDTEIGILEIPKLGSLSPNESLYISKHTAHLPDIRMMAVDLAEAIAAKSNIPTNEAYDALIAGDSAMLGIHIREFAEFQQMLEKRRVENTIALATAVLRYRINPEWDLSHTGDSSLIHPKLVEEIANFANNERSGWIKQEESEPEGKESEVKVGDGIKEPVVAS